MYKIVLPLLHPQAQNIPLVMYFIPLAVDMWETQKRTGFRLLCCGESHQQIHA